MEPFQNHSRTCRGHHKSPLTKGKITLSKRKLLLKTPRINQGQRTQGPWPATAQQPIRPIHRGLLPTRPISSSLEGPAPPRANLHLDRGCSAPRANLRLARGSSTSQANLRLARGQPSTDGAPLVPPGKGIKCPSLPQAP
jgi:hypothetical protein